MKKLVGKVEQAAIPPGTRVQLDYPPFNVLVLNVSGTVYAIDATCNHAGESLLRGRVDGCRISCPAHGYVFDLASGELVTPKGSCDAQRTFDIVREGDAYAIYDDVLTVLAPGERS
jgi:nitrite reductase/ring-hydroxylating ferredoxin subunit